jgi:hypothetical protein
MGPECKTTVTGRSDSDPGKKAPASFINGSSSSFPVAFAQI